LGKVAALVIVAGHVLVAVAAVMQASESAPLAAAVAGLVLFAAGLILIARSQAAMGASWRIGVDPSERTDLVIAGPFAVVRNPIFTGMAVCLTGIAILTWTWLAAAGVAVFVAGIELQVRAVEEPYLRRTHGTAYAHYLRSAGRFLPRLRTRMLVTPD
jgi:protein-S-isoprenylcysteine O-methyltransferase Ste14